MLTNNQFDLAIIGGGPAGSSAAIAAARLGASVVLLEARNFPRHKVCGEFVSAEALGVLAGLLQDVPAGRALLDASPAIQRTRLFLGTRMIEAPVSPPALSITRYDLDAQLWMAAQAGGVETRSNCEVTAAEGSGPFRLTTSWKLFRKSADHRGRPVVTIHVRPDRSSWPQVDWGEGSFSRT